MSNNSWDVSHLMDEQENIWRTSLFWPVQRQAMVIVAYVSHLATTVYPKPCSTMLHVPYIYPQKLGDSGGNYWNIFFDR